MDEIFDFIVVFKYLFFQILPVLLIFTVIHAILDWKFGLDMEERPRPAAWKIDAARVLNFGLLIIFVAPFIILAMEIIQAYMSATISLKDVAPNFASTAFYTLLPAGIIYIGFRANMLILLGSDGREAIT